ncbi:unnamed protein product [Chrysodeixis includens]|uniref:Uncharacterized protein n=1 Tax=Chrysodeixis includens TaxID=689277 RepID=A0A9N8KSY9_CHRIL|nr:unnamed protein product [Chrysodeixis includens]
MYMKSKKYILSKIINLNITVPQETVLNIHPTAGYELKIDLTIMILKTSTRIGNPMECTNAVYLKLHKVSILQHENVKKARHLIINTRNAKRSPRAIAKSARKGSMAAINRWARELCSEGATDGNRHSKLVPRLVPRPVGRRCQLRDSPAGPSAPCI